MAAQQEEPGDMFIWNGKPDHGPGSLRKENIAQMVLNGALKTSVIWKDAQE